jgi:hypothetical protein
MHTFSPDARKGKVFRSGFSCITHHIFAYVYIAGYKCMSIPVFTKSGASGVF